MQVRFQFALPIEPAEARQRHSKDAIVACHSRPYSGGFVYFQTTDRDGFVFPYGKVDWITETECVLNIKTKEPMALMAMCAVEGFGQVMCRADNVGQLYAPGDWIDGELRFFDYEAAASEIHAVEEKLKACRQDGSTIGAQINERLNEARELFRQASEDVDDVKRLNLANRALGKALLAHEELELCIAREKLPGPTAPQPFSFSSFMDGNFGVFSDWKDRPDFQKIYCGLCNTGAVSVFWNKVQPESPEAFDWSYSDEQFAFIEKNRLDAIGHVIGWLQLLPDWVKQIADPEILQTHLLKLLDAMVGRYGHLVRLWSIFNEAHDWFTEVPLSLQDRVRLYKAMREHLARIHPAAAVESDSCLLNAAWRMVKPEWSVGPMEWYKALELAGVRDFVLGLQIYHGGGEYATFSLAEIMRQLRNFVRLGHPLHLYLQTPAGPDENCWGPINGKWHGDWSEELQAEWWKKILTLVLSLPEVRGVTTVSVVDTNPNWMPCGGLVRADLTPKPAYNVISSILKSKTDFKRKTDWKYLS